MVKNNSATKEACTQKIKWQAVENRNKEGWTLKQTRDWLKNIHGIELPTSTISNWTAEYDMYQQGFINLGVTNNVSSKSWTPVEDAELRLGVDLGLSNKEIAQCMNEDENLNNRIYTISSISLRKQRLGLCKQILKYEDWSGNETITNLEQKTKSYLGEDQELVEYVNAKRIFIKCTKCGHVKIQRVNRPSGCPMCVESPNSYYEIYLIQFPDFGNSSVKVGISASYSEKRKLNFPKHKLISVYKTTFMEAMRVENLIKEKYGLYRTTPPELHNNGSTECFDISITDKINKTIKREIND